jgi:hypothetical protein
MPNTISSPLFVVKAGKPVPSIEVDNDGMGASHDNGQWERLVVEFTASWVARKDFAKTATVWMRESPSVAFGREGYSTFIAQFGLPISYLEALQRDLATVLRHHARFSDYVQPSLVDGWRCRVHVQDAAIWVPGQDAMWEKVKPGQPGPEIH